MGLAEKRAANAYQQNKFPAIKSEIAQITGAEIPIEVDWESFMSEGHSDLYENHLSEGMFLPFIEALKSICQDDLGKGALREKLQRITAKATGTTNYFKCELGNGVLELGYNNYEKVGAKGTPDFDKRTQEATENLERAL
jgi:hypothetical protein